MMEPGTNWGDLPFRMAATKRPLTGKDATRGRERLFSVGRVASPVALVMGIVLLVGCRIGGSSSSEEPDKGGHSVKVRPDLPSPPKLGEHPVQLVWPDGSLSVYGLMQFPDRFLNGNVQVTGVVDLVYSCPEGDVPCDEPHLFLVDGEGRSKHRLMVVGYGDLAGAKELEPNRRITVEGTFALRTQRGFVASNGLVEAERIQVAPQEVVEPL